MIFLDPRNDVAFKKIFGSDEHKNITISFLNSILELTGERAIASVDFLNNEQLPQMIDKKDNILDVFCIDQAGNRYIVELQVAHVKEFGKRMVYYGARTYSMQLGKGKSYRYLMPVITLSVVNFIMFPEKKHYKSIHYILDNKTHEHDLPELTFVFVELPKFIKKEQELRSAEDKWFYLIKEIKKHTEIPEPLESDEFGEACHALDRMSWSEQALNAYDDAFVRATDQESSMEIKYEEGRNQRTIEFALTLLKRGVSIEIIAEDTGLSIDEIKRLKKQ